MITLYADEVVLACKKAREEGRLSAFAGTSSRCQYRDDTNNCCAIGAGFTDIEAEELKAKGRNDSALSELVHNYEVSIIEGNIKLVDLYDLQDSHDSIIKMGRRGRDVSSHKDIFDKYLDSLVDKIVQPAT